MNSIISSGRIRFGPDIPVMLQQSDWCFLLDMLRDVAMNFELGESDQRTANYLCEKIHAQIEGEA